MSSASTILASLDTLPTLPATAVRVLEAAADERPDNRQLVRLLEADPALSAGVLRMAARADLACRASNVASAVSMLGLRAVRASVVATGVLYVLPTGEDPPNDFGFSRAELWTHCLAVACCAQAIARTTRAADPGEAFCAGLLHDVGKIALVAALPKSYVKVARAADLLRSNIAEVERRLLGLDHASAGRRLADRWKLPATIRDVIWLHNQHPDALPSLPPASLAAVRVVTLADYVARDRLLGFSGNTTRPDWIHAVASALGINLPDADAACRGVVDDVTARAADLGLACGTTPELYARALDKARHAVDRSQIELDRVRTDARRAGDATRTQLAAQADAFASLSRLGSAVAPEATTHDVLATVARGACHLAGTPWAAAVSLSPGTSSAEYVRVRPSEDRVDAGPLELHHDVPARPVEGWQPAGEGGDDASTWVRPLLDLVAGGEAGVWTTLVTGGQTVGWLVVPSRAGLPDISAVAAGWSLALRTVQVRDAARLLSEQLAESNRRLADAQDQQARDRTLLAVAELAGGAAHEMNNPLMVISGRSQLLCHGLKDVRLRQAALAIHANAMRLSEMITGLMRFARPQTPTPRPVAPGTLLGDACALLGDLREQVGRVTPTFPDDLPPAWVDSSQIARALANVLENALRYSIGTVRVGGGVEPTCRQVVLHVEDDGPGMDARTLRHCCEPFYTRQDAGRRPGMGLPLALRLVESNGGLLRIDSAPGRGVRATFALPCDTDTTRKLNRPAYRASA